MLDPHAAVIAIMKKRKAGMEAPSAEGKLLHDTDGELDPRHMAAEDVMDAFHRKDIHHLKEALSNFHDAHMLHRDKMDEEAED